MKSKMVDVEKIENNSKEKGISKMKNVPIKI